uniref:LRRCT domain-containing protein n=1 Tax=Globodera pallida TaxID=36090 RepID=A0A183BHG7_GLOPA
MTPSLSSPICVLVPLNAAALLFSIYCLFCAFNIVKTTTDKEAKTNFRENLSAKYPAAKCPEGIRFPCACSTAGGDKLAVRCAGANSLEHILFALGPLRERPNLQLDLLRLEHTPIPVLYLDSLRALPPIRRLQLHNNSMAHVLLHHHPVHYISRHSISLLDSLEELAITSNELAHFVHFSPAISPLRSLRSLSLSANRLAEVPAHIFLHFHSRNRIEQLDLSGNSLRDRSIPPEAFLGLGSLQKLSLDKNLLSTVPVKALNELGDSLEELYLAANRIQEMPSGDALALPRLKTLSLDANGISSIDGEFFRTIPSLFYLYLSNNRFAVIAPQMFAFIRELKVLSMNQNPISQLDSQTFKMIPSLLRLELCQCRIALIDDDTFGAVPKLQFVHLGDNKMSRIGWTHFAGKLQFLVSLDLSNNLISHIDPLAFANLAQLQSLDLSGNRVESMAKNTFDGTFLGPNSLSNSRELNLIGNPLDCRSLDGMEWTLAVAEGVTLRGSCEKPAELNGVPLASKQLLIDWWTTERSNGSSSTTSASNGNGSSSSSTWSSTTTAAATTPPDAARGRGALGERRTMAKPIRKVPPSSSVPSPSPTATGHETKFEQSQDKEQQQQQNYANIAVLVLVIVLIVIGTLLATFLCSRQLTVTVPPGNGCPFSTNSRRIPGKKVTSLCWDKLKKQQHYAPPAMLNTLNVLDLPNRGRRCECVHNCAMFSNLELELYPQLNHYHQSQLHQKQWRVQRETFWF